MARIGILALILMVVSPIRISIPIDNWNTVRDGGIQTPIGGGVEAVWPLAIADTLQYDFNGTSNVQIDPEFVDDQFSAAVGVDWIIKWAQEGRTLAFGYITSEVAAPAGLAATTYGVAQVAQSSIGFEFSNEKLYPYFSRICPAAQDYTRAMVDTILWWISTQGEGWAKVGILSAATQLGTDLMGSFTLASRGTPIQILSFQSILPGVENFRAKMQDMKDSGARVIVTFILDNYGIVMDEAKEVGLLGDYHVFFGGPWMSETVNVRNRDGSLNTALADKLRGHVSVGMLLSRTGERYDRMAAHWQSLDPSQVLGAGPGSIPFEYGILAYDMGVLLTKAVVQSYQSGLLTEDRQPTAMEWTRTIRNISFAGATGPLVFEPNGDRKMPLSIINFRAESGVWNVVGSHSEAGGFVPFEQESIVWRDNSTNYPDLLRAPGYYYWSCDAKKRKYDETGHAVKLHAPKGHSHVDDIDATYICDQFIDCQNMSDEGGDCSSNYTALFITFGILTGVLILLTCCLIPFVIGFGFIVPRRRVKASSPTFLILIIFSSLLGYISEFSWYGMPHPVACGFQPWLLGLAVVSLVSALSAKTWRVWKLFRVSFSKQRITDLQLLMQNGLMVIPAVIILIVWSIVSTPTAAIEEVHGEEHWVCTTGGFTGKPGGLIFFFILVAYEGLILVIAAFLCIVTRNVPSFFNESKLIAISIYNLGFLAAVVIPVVLVLRSINPFAAWIIRAVAVLYAFTATLLLQFGPKVVGVIVIDRGKDAALPSLGKVQNSSSSSTSETVTPSIV